MKRQALNLPVLLPVFLVAITLMVGCKQETATLPHIILCMADDQGWGDMAYNGHPVLLTPNFDDMAKSGLRFDRFYAAAPVCSPTRGSVMTGRNPNRFGCFSWGHTLRPQEITVAEALRTAGYVTGHFGKWHLGSVREGSPVNPGNSGFDRWISSPNYFDNDPVLSDQGVAVQTYGESSMVTVDAALEFIRNQAGKDQPFLAVVWFGSPHDPHRAIEQDSALYAGQDQKLCHFYGEITGMDRAFGKLRDELKVLGISENTILWYCSDNGGLPGVGSTGGRGHKAQLYEGGLRVPSLIEWPAVITQPGTTGVPGLTSDIYPTLLEIAGVTMKNQAPLDGISLVPLLKGQMVKRPEPIGFWQYPEAGIRTPTQLLMTALLLEQQTGSPIDSSQLDLHAGDISNQYPLDIFPGHSAWLDWPYKLHRIQEMNGKVVFEFYNLENDPDELFDLSESESALVASMKSQLENWQSSVIMSLNGND
ncbi:MAG: sulfatase-like hydrolase/transferase [Bacteroidales bacterium]